MNEQIPSYLKLKNNTVYYNGEGEFAFFVPEIFFDRNHAIVEGEIIHVIGVLNFSMFKKPEDMTKKVKRFFWPSVFSTKPGRMEKVKNLKLFDNLKADDYRVLYYKNNGIDEIICSIEIPEELANVEEFFSIFVNTGKIPQGVPYDKIDEYYPESMAINGNSFGLSQQEFGIITSEQCRDPENLSRPFRLSKTIDKDMPSYTPISIKQIPKIISPFTAITTENWDEAIINAATIDEKNIISTPMEGIMTGDIKIKSEDEIE